MRNAGEGGSYVSGRGRGGGGGQDHEHAGTLQSCAGRVRGKAACALRRGPAPYLKPGCVCLSVVVPGNTLPFDALSPSCREFLFTSGSGNEGHPDNSWGVCDARRGGSSNMDRIAFKILVVRVLYCEPCTSRVQTVNKGLEHMLTPLTRGPSAPPAGGVQKAPDDGDMLAELSEAESKLIAVGPRRPCVSASQARFCVRTTGRWRPMPSRHPTWRCSGRTAPLRVPGQLRCVLTPRALCAGAQHSTLDAQDDPGQNPVFNDWQARRHR